MLQEPMDLETITDKLHSGCYEMEADFYKDIDLIFKNSFIYNTRSSSTVSFLNDSQISVLYGYFKILFLNTISKVDLGHRSR